MKFYHRYACIGNNIVYIRFGTICNFSHPLQVLECIPTWIRGNYCVGCFQVPTTGVFLVLSPLFNRTINLLSNFTTPSSLPMVNYIYLHFCLYIIEVFKFFFNIMHLMYVLNSSLSHVASAWRAGASCLSLCRTLLSAMRRRVHPRGDNNGSSFVFSRTIQCKAATNRKA